MTKKFFDFMSDKESFVQEMSLLNSNQTQWCNYWFFKNKLVTDGIHYSSKFKAEQAVRGERIAVFQLPFLKGTC